MYKLHDKLHRYEGYVGADRVAVIKCNVYVCIKVTLQGGWFVLEGYRPFGKARFALYTGVSWGQSTDKDALDAFIKRRHTYIAILTHRITDANVTLSVANTKRMHML